jgi:hypothetical protein
MGHRELSVHPTLHIHVDIQTRPRSQTRVVIIPFNSILSREMAPPPVPPPPVPLPLYKPFDPTWPAVWIPPSPTPTIKEPTQTTWLMLDSSDQMSSTIFDQMSGIIFDPPSGLKVCTRMFVRLVSPFSRGGLALRLLIPRAAPRTSDLMQG